MTKEEAIQLENRCDKIMSQYLGEECIVCLALSGRLKIMFNEGDYVTWNMDTNNPAYINYRGFYRDLQKYVKSIKTCISDNFDIFDQLIYSYEHRKELEDT
jgi:hypothetical protein